MPQIPQGQVQPGKDGAPALYGVTKIENTIPFQERLMKLFKASEYVRIRNIDKDPLYWQYLPSDNEEVNMTPDGMQRIITRSAPEMWVINPGEEEVLVGASAYLALDVLYKNVTAKKTLKQSGITSSFNKDNQHIPKNFNFADGGLQEEFIKQAYIGKAEMTFRTADEPADKPKEVAGANK